MTARLTDAELEEAFDYARGSLRMTAIIAELKERRALDLADEERALCHQALGYWRSDYNDAPVDEIEALRERLKR